MPDAKKQGRSNKAMTFFVCFLAALAGLLFGLDIGVIAGALPFIADEFLIVQVVISQPAVRRSEHSDRRLRHELRDYDGVR